jgi:hypothetical protein
MNSEYITNGEANRGAIASAVRFRRLQRTEIENLCAKPEVQSVFIGDSFSGKKKPKSEWDEAYLNSLHGAYYGCFNRDYLLHLDEVAEFVSNANSQKKVIRKMIKAGVSIVLVIIAGIIVYKYIIH